MLTEVAPPEAEPARSAWWVRLPALIPLRVLYGFASFLGWLTYRVFPYRERLVRESLARAFPDFDERQLRSVMRGYYLGFAQMLVEIIKSAALPAQQIRRRVRIVNLEAPRALLEQGQPLDAPYKQLVDSWAEREMKKVRTRFGSRLVPAQDLLPDIIKRRGLVRAA